MELKTSVLESARVEMEKDVLDKTISQQNEDLSELSELRQTMETTNKARARLQHTLDSKVRLMLCFNSQIKVLLEISSFYIKLISQLRTLCFSRKLQKKCFKFS